MIAKVLLETRHDALFAAIARADALPPDEIAKLRAETLAHLQKVRQEGAPYADAVTVAIKEVVGTVAEMNPSAAAMTSIAAKTAKSAFSHAMSHVATAVDAGAKPADPIPDPPAGRAPVPDS